MPDEENEFLWRCYQDHMTHGRHHETLRGTTASILLAIVAGILNHWWRAFAFRSCPTSSDPLPFPLRWSRSFGQVPGRIS